MFKFSKSVPYIYIIWVNFTINWLNLFPIRGYSFNIGIFTRVVANNVEVWRKFNNNIGKVYNIRDQKVIFIIQIDLFRNQNILLEWKQIVAD